jgi:hypothetical protein
MTESEEKLFDNLMSHNSPYYGYELCKGEIKTILQGFEELKQYRAIGTVSEFRELKEKATAKKVQYDEYGRDEGYPHCSRCSDSLINDFVNVNYCPSCGQKLDWSEGKE